MPQAVPHVESHHQYLPSRAGRELDAAPRPLACTDVIAEGGFE